MTYVAKDNLAGLSRRKQRGLQKAEIERKEDREIKRDRETRTQELTNSSLHSARDGQEVSVPDLWP